MLSQECSSPFVLYDAPDSHNCKFTIAQLAQGGLGLPDCSYCMDADKKNIRWAYQSLILDTFTALETQYKYFYKSRLEDIAQSVYDLEVKIARVLSNKIDWKEQYLTHNTMHIHQLQSTIRIIVKD